MTGDQIRYDPPPGADDGPLAKAPPETQEAVDVQVDELSNGDGANINHFLVDANKRGKGHGSRAMEALLDGLEAEGKEYVAVNIGTGGGEPDGVVDWLEGYGFEIEEARPGHVDGILELDERTDPARKAAGLEPLGAWFKADWAEESGPEGATRWRNTETGEVRYREPAGSDHEAPEGFVDASNVEEGDELVIDGADVEVTRVSDMGGGFFVAGEADDGSIETARVGPNHDFEEAPDGDDELARWESLVDPPQDGVDPSALADDSAEVIVDGERMRVSRHYRASGETRMFPVDGPGGAKSGDYVRMGAEELEESLDGVVDQDPDPSDLNEAERLTAAHIAASGLTAGSGGNQETSWREYGEVLDLMDDDELATALERKVLSMPETGVSGVRKGNAPLRMVMEQDLGDEHVEGLVGTTTSADDLAVLTSRMSGDALVEAVDRIFERAEEIDVESADTITEDEVARDESLGTLRAAAIAFAPTQEAREEVADRHDPPNPDSRLGGEKDVARMATAESYDDFKAAWIGGWHTSGNTPVASATEVALQDFGPNEGEDVVAWTHGKPIADIDTTPYDEFFGDMYEETQDALDGDETLYRGVSGRTTTHASMESWSEREDIAEKFDDHVMEAEVDPGDVLATWQTLGDEWPEDFVKGKEEWMVFGGSLQ